MAESTKREKMARKDTLVQLHALDLGKNLRVLRKNKGWSQGMLAEMLGTEHPRISNIERGLVDVRISDVIEFARIFEVNPQELLNFSKYDPDEYPVPPPTNHAHL